PGVLRPEGPGGTAHAARVPGALRGAPDAGGRRRPRPGRGNGGRAVRSPLRADARGGGPRRRGGDGGAGAGHGGGRGPDPRRRGGGGGGPPRRRGRGPDPPPSAAPGGGGGPAMSERLQKFLARAGVASRRHAEGLITAGRVAVNNQVVTTLGTKVSPGDLVTV